MRYHRRLWRSNTCSGDDHPIERDLLTGEIKNKMKWTGETRIHNTPNGLSIKQYEYQNYQACRCGHTVIDGSKVWRDTPPEAFEEE